MDEQQKRSPFYRSIFFWFIVLVIIFGIGGLVIGEEIPDWLEYIRRLLR